MGLNRQILSTAARDARGLAMDAVSACKSGHLGLPLGAAEMGAVLFGHALRIFPTEAHWIDRDRFVLSAGHGSMFLYAWLHLSGYALSLAELKAFRQLGSHTPGHPEHGETSGVESTTGPLGQGVGNAVGMAVAAKMAQAAFNTDQHAIFDHRIVCLAGDGCLQEGVAAEAAAFAGHTGLDNLILIYDSNDVTLDAPAESTQSENTALRFQAYGFDTVEIDGHNMEAFLDAFLGARSDVNGHPKLIIAKTEIGRGIEEVAGTFKAHGEAGAPFVAQARQHLGLPEEPFHVSTEVRNFFAARLRAQKDEFEAWQETFSAWSQANPEKAQLLQAGLSRALPADLIDRIPEFPPDAELETRSAGRDVIQPLAQLLPLLISGSADLHGSTRNYINDAGDFSAQKASGRNILFGIREHAMGAIVNGIGYYGIFRASGSTFTVFSDYMRPSIRLAALAKLPIFHIFTHDSVGVGEDGPTHQPVETVSALRCIPGLDVIRPADPEETAGAFCAALERTDGPSALILTRQKVPNLNEIPVAQRRNGVLQGAYIAKRETGPLEAIIISSGSELQHALQAAHELGAGTRVVSMPCFERFARQSAAYRESVLPSACRRRVAIEAGVTSLWHQFVGLDGAVVGIDRFGLSAPGAQVMEKLGMTAASVVQAVNSL